MIKDTISDDMINLRLRQLGAKSIKTTPAHVNIVKFAISDEVSITYLYEIKETGEIYLQRVNPYLMMMGRLYTDRSLINMMIKDVELFRNAYNSRNYDKFIQLVNSHLRFGKDLESLFIGHNVSPEDLDEILNRIEEGKQLLEDIRDRSKSVLD